MAKVTLNDTLSGYASITTLNENFAAIEAAFENTLSRDGTTPNHMEADLDMNSNDLLNVGDISAQDVIVDGQSFGAAITDAQNAAASAEVAAQAAIGAAAIVSAGTCCLDSATSFFDFGLITDTAALFPTDFGSVV
jgi:hypothetical protein